MKEECVKFAEWLAENHYRLCNIDGGVRYWESGEDGEDDEEPIREYSTDELYKLYESK